VPDIPGLSHPGSAQGRPAPKCTPWCGFASRAGAAKGRELLLLRRGVFSANTMKPQEGISAGREAVLARKKRLNAKGAKPHGALQSKGTAAVRVPLTAAVRRIPRRCAFDRRDVFRESNAVRDRAHRGCASARDCPDRCASNPCRRESARGRIR
jgi:hypothetical protein